MKTQYPKNYAQLDAFAQGINDRVSGMRWLPVEYYLIGVKWEEWTVEDSLAVSKMF